MTRHTPLSCPVCKAPITAAAPLDPANDNDPTYHPAPGAITICLKCGALLEYVEVPTLPSPLALSRCSPEALHELKTEQPSEYDMLLRVQAAIHQSHAKQN